MLRRLQVLMTLRSLAVLAASTFLRRWPSMNGPFLRLRPIRSLLLPSANDEAARDLLLVAGLEALGLLAPRADRRPPPGRAALAATVRVIDGVHRATAVVRL